MAVFNGGQKESPHGARAVHPHTRARVRTHTHTHTPVGPHPAPASFPGFPRIPRDLPTFFFFYVHVVADVRAEMPDLRLLLVHLVAHAQAGRDRLDALTQRHPLGWVVDLAAAAQVEAAVLAVEVGHTGGKEGRGGGGSREFLRFAKVRGTHAHNTPTHRARARCGPREAFFTR